jgi:hypothetical protein
MRANRTNNNIERVYDNQGVLKYRDRLPKCIKSIVPCKFDDKVGRAALERYAVHTYAPNSGRRDSQCEGTELIGHKVTDGDGLQ